MYDGARALETGIKCKSWAGGCDCPMGLAWIGTGLSTQLSEASSAHSWGTPREATANCCMTGKNVNRSGECARRKICSMLCGTD